MTTDSGIVEAKWSISLSTLTTIAVSLLTGAAFAELLRNVAGSEQLNFTTTEIIGFVLSVVLSAASIVLAIAAIWMGKITELSIIKRSDESIRLQNEIFVRTTEALQRIEASTGVTEKRIEDIIQGRVGDISHRIAELATNRSGLGKDRASLEEEIKNSILQSVRPNSLSIDSADFEAARERINQRQKRYKEYHEVLLKSCANMPEAKTVKLGDGSYKGSGYQLFDVVVEIDGRKMGASAILSTAALDGEFPEYVLRVGRAILDGSVDRVALFVDGEKDDQSKLEEIVATSLGQLKGDLHEKVRIKAVAATDLPAAVTDAAA